MVGGAVPGLARDVQVAVAVDVAHARVVAARVHGGDVLLESALAVVAVALGPDAVQEDARVVCFSDAIAPSAANSPSTANA